MNNTLYVCTVVFNSQRFRSRIALYHNFEKYVKDSGAQLYTVEIAFGNRPFVVTEANDTTDLQLRTNQEIWLKESALNCLIQRLPSDWQYVAWIDADVEFPRPDWAVETVELLQHYPILQLFSQAADLSPKFELLKTHVGIISAYQDGIFKCEAGKYEQFHPGFTWAARREALNNLGGLFDVGILGSADRQMALSLLEMGARSYPDGISNGYKESVDLWQDRCKRYIKKNVGCMPGLLRHFWHGSKKNRQYQSRWKILIDHGFDPEFDLKKDVQGLWQLTDRNPQLAYDIRRYFHSRNEDSIDL